MRHFRPEAEKRIAELCAREVVCTLVAGVSRVEPTRLSPSLKTLSDGLRRSPPLEHKLHRKKGNPHKPNLNPVSCGTQRKVTRRYDACVRCDCVCGRLAPCREVFCAMTFHH